MSAAEANPLRLAVVGCGRIAADYFQALAALQEYRVVAAVDPEPTRCESLAPGASSHRGLDGLLKHHGESLDAALVLTPPDTHRELASRLLAHGCHVFCEKPLTVNTEEAKGMLAAANDSKRTLMMGSKFRYVPDVDMARRLLQEDCIGRVALFEISFCGPVDMSDRWNADPATAGGGVLIDNGCHAVDVARYLIGPIDGVHAAFGPDLQGLPVEDTARILFQFREGALGAVDVSWSVGKAQDAYVRVHGERGTLEVGFQQSRYRVHGADGWTGFGQGYDKRVAFRRQLEDFAKAIRGGTPTIDGEDALASVQVIDAAYRSARSGGWESVNP